MKIYRHGDLLIREISELPKNLKKLETKTLALGEATGHHHTLVADILEVFEDEKGNKFFQLEEKAELTHQEHKTIGIEKGLFEVIIERERDPFTEQINKVRD